MGTIAFLSQLLLLGLSIFLMIVILLQRGRGGGLAGAFGGLGGQSAFGTKAGDVFTKITIGIAVCWVIVAGGSRYFLNAGAEQRAQGLGEGPAGVSSAEGEDEGADDEFPLPPFDDPLGGDTNAAPADDTGTDSAPADDSETAAPAPQDGSSEPGAADAKPPEGSNDSASDGNQE